VQNNILTGREGMSVRGVMLVLLCTVWQAYQADLLGGKRKEESPDTHGTAVPSLPPLVFRGALVSR